NQAICPARTRPAGQAIATIAPGRPAIGRCEGSRPCWARRVRGIPAVRISAPSRVEPTMVATVLVGMLCVYALSFSIMFLLISRRLGADRMGMDAFAMGNLVLSVAYVLQLLEGPAGWGWMGVVNHSFTLCSLLAYAIGGARFFRPPAPLWRPLLALAVGYAALQVLVHSVWGPVARYALLSATCVVFFAGMVVVLLGGLRTFARGLCAEVVLFVVLISGICVLNAMKLAK